MSVELASWLVLSVVLLLLLFLADKLMQVDADEFEEEVDDDEAEDVEADDETVSQHSSK